MVGVDDKRPGLMGYGRGGKQAWVTSLTPLRQHCCVANATVVMVVKWGGHHVPGSRGMWASQEQMR